MSSLDIATQAPRVYPTSLRQAWLPLLALCLAFFVEMADNTILTIALPTIGADLGAGTSGLQWITAAYSLTFGGLLLTGGSLADRFGRRRVLLFALGGFGLVSALTMFVDEPWQLIAVRALLGVCAAGMAPVTNSLIFRLFDDDVLRMRAITLMVVVGMSGMALGPVLAGAALAQVSWHWLLLINIPIAAVGWVGVRFGVAGDEPDGLRKEPLDLPGAAWVMAAMALGGYALTSGVENGWTSASTLASAAGCAVAVVGFIRRERRTSAPMLNLALLRNRTIAGATLAQLGGFIAMIGVMFALMLHFQDAYGWSPMVAGLANLPFVVTMLAGTPVAERLIATVGHRMATIVAAILLTGSLLGMAVAVPHGYLPIAIAMVVMTMGLRIIMTVCPIAIMGTVPDDLTSTGAALNDTAQEVGTNIGVAVTGSVLTAALGAAAVGGWGPETVSAYFHGEQIAFAVLAVLAGATTIYGATTLTASRDHEEQH